MSKYLYLVFALALAGVYTLQEVRVSRVKSELVESQRENARLTAAYAKERSDLQGKIDKIRDESTKVTETLQAKADDERKVKNDEIRKLSARAAELKRLLDLRDKAAAAAKPNASSANDSQAGQATDGDTGAGISAAPGGAGENNTVDEALRADVIRVSLIECYRVYDATVSTMEDFRVKAGQINQDAAQDAE